MSDRPDALRPPVGQPDASRESHPATDGTEAPAGGWDVDADTLDTLVRYADSLRESEKLPEAIAAYEQARQFGAEPERVDYALAALGVLPRPPHTPPDVVKSHFDDFAEVFESHLIDTLNYRAPQCLCEALEGVLPAHPLDVLDLGCGTGLCAPLLRPAARRLVGVDLSQRMLERAAQQGDYDELVCAEATQMLRASPDSQDVVVAADVLMYFGELDELFAATHVALRAGGLFAFSAEAGDAAEIELRPNLRFAHSHGYLRKLARRHHFAVESMAQAPIRQERLADVQAHIVVLRVM